MKKGERRTSSSICVYCGVRPVRHLTGLKARLLDSYSNDCTSCCNDYKRKYRKWVETGVDKPVRPRPIGGNRLEARAKSAKERRLFYKENGVCIVCGGERMPGLLRCESCRASLIKRTKNRKRALRKKAVDYMGNKCSDCLQSFKCLAVYDFHHIDPTNKSTNISYLGTWAKICEELKKCIMLCSNCHRTRHWLYEEAA